MGGLQAMWAAALDPDVSEANLEVPWCCDMGGRETLKRNSVTWGVGETVALRYFDPVNMAKRVSTKCKLTIVRAGLGDYTCPPSGIAVMYNNLKCDKAIKWVQGSTHGHVPPDGFGNQSFTMHAEARE
jgi:cephalosporin-C deacetylase-like acetyl esterase